MKLFKVNDGVGESVTRCLALAQVFDKAGIDYCYAGEKTIEEACSEAGIDSQTLMDDLNEAAQEKTGEPILDITAMTLTELADHIESTHHAYLRTAFSKLHELIEKVVSAHGEQDLRLHQLKSKFEALTAELSSHMMKEERILFPMVRQLDKSDAAPEFHCGSLSNPIRQMEMEHTQAGGVLEELRQLTDTYTPPDWACDTYRAMLGSLAHLEQDLRMHIHKESGVLFPRAIESESIKSA